MSRNKFYLGQQKGAAVILALVIAGAAMFVVMASLQTQADDSYKRLKLGRLRKNDSGILRVTMNFVLNTYSGCFANFAHQRIGSHETLDVTVFSYADETGARADDILNLSTTEGRRFGHRWIQRIYLEPDPEKFGPDGAGNHLTRLNVQYRDGTGFQIPIYVTTDASGQILGCHSTTWAGVDSKGQPETLEEHLCGSTSIPRQTNDWYATDCLQCLTSSDLIRSCVICKQKGMSFDPVTKKCI